MFENMPTSILHGTWNDPEDFLQKNPESLGANRFGELGGHFYCKYNEKNSQKAPLNYSASFWTGSFQDSLWENLKPQPFYGFWTWRTTLLPKPIILDFGMHQDTLNIQEIPNHFQTYDVWKPENLKTCTFGSVPIF